MADRGNAAPEPMGQGREDGETKPKKKQVCRFYATKKGCRAGAACPFQHPQAPPGAYETGLPERPASNKGAEPPKTSAQAILPQAAASRVVPKPVSQAAAEDPRAFQVGQIQRRFKPVVTEANERTDCKFSIVPSDPDFPYEIDALECILSVPKSYPSTGKPKLRVTNNDIPRGFQINIEKGFDLLASTSPNATLLGLMNRLDKQLEQILSGQMAETIKLISNRGPSQPQQQSTKPLQAPVVLPAKVSMPAKPSATTEGQRAVALAKRRTAARQLEARFGKVQFFHKSSDGLNYTLPLDSPKRGKWPPALRGLKKFVLVLPDLYPLEPCFIHLASDSEEARAVEQAFLNHVEATATEDASLTQLVNHLTIHIADMAKMSKPPQAVKPEKAANQQEIKTHEPDNAQKTTEQAAPVGDLDRQHIVHIPRPPEWAPKTKDSPEEDSDSTGSDYSYDTGDETEDHVADVHTNTTSAPAERGILLSLPHLELHGIELLELTSLCLTIKCQRCKDMMDVEKLRNNVSGDLSGSRTESCKKCAQALIVGFRADMMHANSARAGYLDIDNCTVIDMLPSNFVPTCSECSTAYPAPGLLSVRGESAMGNCRECHHRMSFRIPEVKFLQISQAAARATRAPQRKKVKENLGITAGSELPRRGRCKHYSKSYRWFRFSCCGKVYPCDRCHDEASDHPNEHANRMLCGFCSREQNYRPEDCATCHAPLTGKKGSGFWEGGKGTRDPARMSKKDPRKYKRRQKPGKA